MAPAPGGSPDEQDVEVVVALELALLTPEVRRSRARLEELLDPDFSEVGASGRSWDRDRIVAALLDDVHDEAIQVADVQGTVVAPGVVLLRYVSDPAGRAARRSSLWRRSGGRWRILHHQGTLLSV